MGFADRLGSPSAFFDKVLNFLGIGIALYIIANVYGWASNDSVIKRTVKCKYCRKRISQKASAYVALALRERVLMAHLGTAVCELYELAGW